jgi:hypothetical protein
LNTLWQMESQWGNCLCFHHGYSLKKKSGTVFCKCRPLSSE